MLADQAPVHEQRETDNHINTSIYVQTHAHKRTYRYMHIPKHINTQEEVFFQ